MTKKKKIAAQEAARKVMEARKLAMVYVDVDPKVLKMVTNEVKKSLKKTMKKKIEKKMKKLELKI
jgi:hypothetical protein